MFKTKSFLKAEAANTKTMNACKQMLATSVARIQKQGSGCAHPKTGACYKYAGKRDAIAILINPEIIRSMSYGLISSDEQSYIVNAIMHKYQLRVDDSTVRVKVKVFLQQLQDAHDQAFDQYNGIPENPMEYFLAKCKEIEQSLNAN